MGSILDLHDKNGVRPAVCYRFLSIPQARLRITQPFEQSDVVVPGNLCKTLLHNLALWPSRCKGTHVFEVARGKFMKVKGKVWVDSYGAEIILFIKISDLINN
jgi:hypothetical protein